MLKVGAMDQLGCYCILKLSEKMRNKFFLLNDFLVYKNNMVFLLQGGFEGSLNVVPNEMFLGQYNFLKKHHIELKKQNYFPTWYLATSRLILFKTLRHKTAI